ncbi:MAG: UDP-glucose 4-epimerase GalE [Trueperaceae bacterium]
MKVLVTGGAGYIGSVTVEALLARGHEPIVLDDLSTGHRSSVPDGVPFVHGSVADPDMVAYAVNDLGAEAVLHFAAFSLVGESMSNPMKYFGNNTAGTLTLLGTLARWGVKRFVLSSTAAVYGTPDAVPIPESAALRPESVYGESKLLIERALGWLARTSEFGFAALRYFNAAGASELRGEDHRPESHLIPLTLQVAAGKREHIAVFGDDYPTPDGTAVRDYVHVQDLADAHVLALEALQPGDERVYNLGNGRGYSVREVIDVCRLVTGATIPEVAAPRRAGDPPVLVADSSKARAELGWAPAREGLEEMVASAWAWHQAHPDGYEAPAER